MRVLILLLALCAEAFSGDLPDAALTPGVTRTDLPESAICTTKWGLDHRAVTPAMKQEVLARYHMTPADCPSRKIEIDHKRPREMLGADAIKNLWGQCYEKKVPRRTASQSPEWGAHKKDRLENRIHRDYCAGKITLDQANTAFDDWIAAYRKVFGK